MMQGMQGGMPEMGPQGQISPSPNMQQQLPQSQMPQPEPEETQDDQNQENMENLIDFALSEVNIAKRLKNKKTKNGSLLLEDIGNEVVQGWLEDEDSRKNWLECNKEWIKMSMLVRETKTYPWPKASNVKYPLLSTAAMQFSARAYPALVPSDGKIVKAKVIPYDPTGQIGEKAERIAKHMSYQIMCKMHNWEEDMDKLLMTMAISGICFKKTYHNSQTGIHESKLVYPEDFCINYWAKSVEKAYRKTEILYYNQNEYEEKKRNNEEFLDIDLESPSNPMFPVVPKPEQVDSSITIPSPDKTTPHVFLAQHTYWDLDNDGYEEPYIIVVHRDTKKVVRIISRWDMKGVQRDEKGKVLRIEPIEYFTAFPFIPNPDGSMYALGFGLLLGPINESVNSLINMLVDSGTLNNIQAGFIGKGLRMKMGQTALQSGEWRAVNATGDDLNKSIFPLPTKEPSGVLMNLLNMLITSGNQLASIAEIFVGKMPGQNTPATTTQETVKQGMAVFTAIYKRVYRSLYSEFKKLHRLNVISPGILEEESRELGIQIMVSDYEDDNYIIPGGDPTGDSETEKAAKVQQVGQMLQLGTIDPMKFTEWALQAGEIPNFQNLIAQPQQPKPDPEQQKAQAEMQVMQQKAQLDSQAKQ